MRMRIAPRGRGAYQQANLDLADNALRDAVRLGMCLDDGAGVELQIPDPVAVGEQRLHPQHDLACAWRDLSLLERQTL